MAHLEEFVSEIFLDLKRFTLGISANSMQIYSSFGGEIRNLLQGCGMSIVGNGRE